MFKKLNNKGDTLAIVLIGMFVLSILGTLILGVTATNFNMKVSDKKAESAFYYAEKAIDEVYAGIGREVMGCIQEEYTDIIEKYYSNNKNIPSYVAKNDFGEKIRNELTELYMDGTIKNQPGVTNTDPRVDLLIGRILQFDTGTNKGIYIKNIDSQPGSNTFTLSGAANYEFTIFSPSSSPTSIQYSRKPDAAAGETEYVVLGSNAGDDYKKVDRIEIKNFGIRCDSKSNGYTSSIVTDFVIDIPDIGDIDLSDSGLSGDKLDELAKYSLIAQGHNLLQGAYIDAGARQSNNSSGAAINISDNLNVNISGNVYADGTLYNIDPLATKTLNGHTIYSNDYGNIAGKNDSVRVGSDITAIVGRQASSNNTNYNDNSNVRLRINSKVFANINDFVVKRGSTVTMRNRDGGEYGGNEINALQFYVNNIRTVGSGPKQQNLEASEIRTEIDISGNSIVKDDLQLDGDNNYITLSGNYFGYGFRGDKDTGVESNSSAFSNIQNATEINAFAINNIEHESSSAIVINGRTTELDMANMSKTIIMGRSYIDLEDVGTTNGYYMTGESISVKGNQHMYLAGDGPLELGNSKVAGLNPIPYDNASADTDLVRLVGKSSGITYADLGLFNDNVVAKRMGNSVYFYVVNNNPLNQTAYFMSSYGNEDKRKTLNNKLNELDVKKVDVGGDIYSVGAAFNVVSSSGKSELRNLSSEANGDMTISKTEALGIVKAIESRCKHLTPYLQDDSNSGYILGTNNQLVDDPLGTTLAKSPYEYYVNRDKVFESVNVGGRKQVIIANNNKNDVLGINASAEDWNKFKAQLTEILSNLSSVEGINIDLTNVGYCISTEQGKNPVIPDNMKAGVIIAEGNVAIGHDFVGLVLTNSEIIISGNINIHACEDLTKLLLRTVPDLNNVLNDEVKNGSTGTPGTGAIVNAKTFKYTDIVKKENWKRDTDY